MKKGILTVVLLSLVACGGDSPTSPSYVPPPSSTSSTGNTSAELLEVSVTIWDHTFDDLGCEGNSITIFFDGEYAGVLRYPGLRKIATMELGKYPEGSVHTLRAVSCESEIWEETFTLRFPGKIIMPYVD